MSVHEFTLKSIEGTETPLSTYKGKVLLVVNTASECGFTYQYEGLEKLYEEYRDKGVEVLGIPCNQFGAQEPGDNEQVKNFCSVKFGVGFPLFAKTDVRGETAHPLYKYLIAKAPYAGIDESTAGGGMLLGHLRKNFPAEYLQDNEVKWNFTKFLVDQEGNVVARFESPVEPAAVAEAIDRLL